MALKLTGNLNVELIEGKYGTFSVGTVTTDLGTFSVKDKVLDQFKPGKYDGEFVVEKIQAESFTTKSGIFVKTRAWLSDVVVYDNEPVGEAESDIPTDPDPLEQDNNAPAPVENPTIKGELKEESDDDVPLNYDETGMALFGLMFPLGKKVKLDATSSRDVIRKQTKYLNDHGYEFKPRDQVWVKLQV